MIFPNRESIFGKIINEYLQNKQNNINDECIHLLFTADRWNSNKEILDTLNKGISIICDRYYFSGVAYSSAKGLSIDWCLSPENGLPEPDLIFFLDGNPEELLKRSGRGEEKYEKKEFQEKVREQFFKIKNYHINKLNKNNWIIINSMKSQEEIFNEIKINILNFFK